MLYWHNGHGGVVTGASRDEGVDVTVYDKKKDSRLLFIVSAKRTTIHLIY